jgi:putative nucleotidyltransferase with HDIG domain
MNDDTIRLAVVLKGPLEPEGGEATPSPEQRAQRLRKVTESVFTLPTLPAIFDGLLRMLDDPNTSTRTLSQALARDQVLTARLLKTANSAFYGFPQRVSTTSLALVVLGMDATRDVVLATSVMETFRKTRSDGRFDMAKFWDHSLAVAVAARELARRLRWESPGEVFTAGLLHDLGQVVLHEHQPDLFQEVIRRIRDAAADPKETELDVLGATHPQVGGWLCRHWNLPGALCDAVEYHHSPADCKTENQALAALVAIADGMAHETEIGGKWLGKPSAEFDMANLAILSSHGITVREEDLPVLQAAVAAEVERAASLGEAFR